MPLSVTPVHGQERLTVDCPICAWSWDRHSILPRAVDYLLMERSWNRHLQGRAHRTAFVRMSERFTQGQETQQ